jgi:dolichol-phosphate mannosyltransferase
LRTTVIIPTYNEAENLPKLVSALFTLPLDLSVLVVDDNSPDGTGKIADQLAETYPGRIQVLHREEKTGLRSAYLAGFKAALETDAEALVQMDADFSHDPQVLVAMTERIQTCDMVLGSRYVSGGSTDRDWPAWRKGLSAFGNFYARTILGLPFNDVTTGYRFWRRETIEGMPLERVAARGYIFLVEMAYLAHCLGYRIEEVPIYFADRRWGQSKMSFRIQAEAAFHVWEVLFAYRDLKKMGEAARQH